MSVRRELISLYLIVGIGLVAGVLVGVFVLDTRPAVVGWFFGAGAGLALGAFIAAISSGVPLAGSGQSRPADEARPPPAEQPPGHDNDGVEGQGRPSS